MENYSWIKDLLLVIGSTGVSSIVLYFVNKRNIDRESIASSRSKEAEASQKMIQAAGELVTITEKVVRLKEDTLEDCLNRVEDLSREVLTLKKKVTKLESRYGYLLSAARKLMIGIEILVTQINSYNKVPLWIPSNDIKEFILSESKDDTEQSSSG